MLRPEVLCEKCDTHYKLAVQESHHFGGLRAFHWKLVEMIRQKEEVLQGESGHESISVA